MATKSFQIQYAGLKLVFDVCKGKINLLYCGLDKKTKRVKKSERQFYHFAEAEYLEGTENARRGLKLNNTSFGQTCNFVGYEAKEKAKGLELIVITKNKLLQLETHFFLYRDAKAISSYNIAKNIGKTPLELFFVPSFFWQGIMPSNRKSAYLHVATNSWHREAQWSRFALQDLGIYNGNENSSMGRYSLNNTGAWSTKEYLPMAVLEDSAKHEATLVQVESNGSWHIELGDFANIVYLSASGPEFFDNQWSKNLMPGETFQSVQATVSFGSDFESVVQEITKARRLMRRKMEDCEKLPVIFNDYMHALWDTQTTDTIKPLVDVAAQVGCDEFCIDAGWFAKGNAWWNIIGNWEEYKDNFPGGGLKAVIDYIKSKGMRAGIWFEIEAVGIHSPALAKMKDDWFFQIHGKPIVATERYQLDFSNPEVYQYAMSVIDKTMALYNLDYIKMDFNFDAGVGTDVNSDSLGDGLLKHNRAYVKWLNEVLDKYPNLTIENCASGGCRMDYEMLKYSPIQSTSDQTNYRKYPYLSANVLTACTPEQAAVWSYPLNDYEKIMPTDEVVAMNMANAMLGRIHLASFIDKLPERQLDLIREGLSFYRSISDMKKKSVPIFPKGTCKFFDKDVVGGICSDDEGVLGVWNTSGKPRNVRVNLAKYGIKTLDVGYPLSLQTDYSFDAESGILVVNFPESYGGRIFTFKK